MNLELYLDPGSNRWCATPDHARWSAEVQRTGAESVATATYVGSAVRFIQITQEDAPGAGDWLVRDSYTLGDDGEPVAVVRAVRILPGDARIVERFATRQGKARKVRRDLFRLSTGKAIASFPGWTPEVPILVRREEFPFIELFSRPYQPRETQCTTAPALGAASPLELKVAVTAERNCSDDGQTIAHQLDLRVTYHNGGPTPIAVEKGAGPSQVMVALTEAQARAGTYVSVEMPDSIGLGTDPMRGRFVLIPPGQDYAEEMPTVTVTAQLPVGRITSHIPLPGRYYVRLTIPNRVRIRGKVALMNLTTSAFPVTIPPKIACAPWPRTSTRKRKGR